MRSIGSSGSGSGSVMEDRSDHGTSKEPMNPFRWSGNPWNSDPDHPKGTDPGLHVLRGLCNGYAHNVL